jgi:vancomycin resistance protein YoaR
VAEAEQTRVIPPLPDEEDEGWTAKLPEWWWHPMARRRVLVAAAAIGALVLLYGLDLLISHGEVPRGVAVGGVHLAGLDKAAAERTLRGALEPRLKEPVPVRAGDVETTVDAADAGLAIDWSRTIDRASDQPLNPWTRLRSLFADREVGTVSTADAAKLNAAVEALRPRTDHGSAEGTIKFDGLTPTAVDPRPGQKLDAAGAARALQDGWALGRTVELPVAQTPVRSTRQSVRAALDGIAKPAVSGPVRVAGDGADALLGPETIAAALSFEVEPGGALTPRYDLAKITTVLAPQLARTEKPGKDATIVIEGDRPVVKPAVDGRGVDWPKTLAGLPDVLRRTDDRTLAASYGDQPAKFTTEQANALGVKEVIGEFTTGGFAQDSGVNIRQIAAEVNGALLKPGEEFSLNGYTGPRGVPEGYVEAGVIESGKPARAVGGGCSQFATTLYNAAYFAGMTDVKHKEHSFYISRYPEGREATVFEGLIDLVFRNDAPTGALIETSWTPTSVTVRIWGTKNYDVESVTGGRSNFTQPDTVTIPAGEKCQASSGSQGFTVTNTKIVRDARTGKELSRATRTVVYNPAPKVVCNGPSG